MVEISKMRLMPGEYHVTTENEEISTILGSCVALCIKDAEMNVAGMNHYLCPTRKNSGSSTNLPAACFGDASIGLLLKLYMLNGGRLEKCNIKLFGGGQVMSDRSNVGGENIKIAQDIINEHNLVIDKSDVGGSYSRKIIFSPKTGKVKVFKLSAVHNKFIDAAENTVDETRESITSLFYLSTLSANFTNDDLLSIQESSQRNNKLNNITGLLLIRGKHVLQILEGSENAVNACFKKISKDARHAISFTHKIGIIPKREFSNWAMKIKIISDVNIANIGADKEKVEQCFESDNFESNVSQNYQILKSFYKE